jgi:hypothetical protein
LVAEVTMRRPNGFDIAALAAQMRPADVDECFAASGHTPFEATLLSVEHSSECYAVYFGPDIACIWGVVDMGNGIGCGWLLTSATVDEQPRLFWTTCLALLPVILGNWDVLVNAIDCRHTQALRWAKRLGFRLEAPEAYGVGQVPFQTFTVTRGDLRV